MRKKRNEVDMSNFIPPNQEKIEEQPQFKFNYHQISQITNNYVTEEETKAKKEETLLKTEGSEGFIMSIDWETNDTFPTFLAEATKVLIPRGVKRRLERLPKRVLSCIDKDKTLAVEKCLMAVSSLTSALFMDDSDSWKALNSGVLHEQSKKSNDNTFIYPRVLEALQYSTSSTEPIIESKKNSEGKESYQTGVVSKQYRYTKTYREKSLSSYEFKTKECIAKRRKYQYKLLAKASNNIIGSNLLNVYPLINLPAEEEIIVRAKELVKESYHSKKGKLLTFLNHRKKGDFSDDVERSFVEDNIKQFNYLTKEGFLTPVIGNDRSGGRVVDSFNLMPSWIRMMCNIDDEEMVELDYSALHPNIAMSIYQGKERFLTHQKVAERLNCDLSIVKKEHLSFFNKHPNDMEKSILYGYYRNREDKILANLLIDKKKRGYRNTSKRLFKKEVDIMSQCIKQINDKGIYVIYVYDALYCKKSDVAIVKTIMNETILQFGVYTIVKSSEQEKSNNVPGYIYKVENIENGMVYIGSTTKTVEKRKKDHIKKARKGAGSLFHEAIATYGPDSFKWDCIDIASTTDELALKEKKYIADYNAYENGYNNDCGGGFKKTIYQFTREGLLIGQWKSLNEAALKVLGTEKGISNVCLGYSKSYKGYYWSYGKNFTIPEDLRKKRVCQYDLENKLIQCFDSVAEASRYNGLSKSAISRVCRGERDKSGGYIWRYV